MSRLEELINELCPNGVRYKKLRDVATISRGGNFQKKDYVEQGFPCIHYGQIYTQYRLFIYNTANFIDENMAEKQKKAVTNDIIMAVTSENVDDVCKCIAWLGEGEIAVSGHTAIIHHTLNPKYLVYYLHSSMFFAQKVKLAHGTKVIEVKPDSLGDVVLPVPPIEVQREIVRILDNFTELTAELTAELTVRKQQYEYYRNEMLTFDNNVKVVPLGSIADISTGSSNTNEGLEDGLYPFFVRSQEPLRKNEYEFDETAIITAGDGVGVGKVYHYVEGKYALHQRAYRIHITNPEVLPRYYFHYMRSAFLSYIEKTMYQGSVASIRRPMLNAFPVYVPAIDVQERLINVLDNFEAICSDLNIGLPAEIEARQKQYEYYRDRLLTFIKTSTQSQRQTYRQTDRQTRQGEIKLMQYVFGFVYVQLDEVIISLNTGLNPRKFFKLNTDDANNYYITIREIVNGRIVPTEKTDRMDDVAMGLCNKRSNLERGDVLFSGTGTIGETAVLEETPANWNIKEGVYAIKPDQVFLNSKYLRYVLMTKKIKDSYMRKVAGGTVKSIPMKDMRLLWIPLPSINRQKKLVDVIDHFDHLCNDISEGLPAEIEARQKQYEYYRDKLLSFKPMDKQEAS